MITILRTAIVALFLCSACTSHHRREITLKDLRDAESIRLASGQSVSWRPPMRASPLWEDWGEVPDNQVMAVKTFSRWKGIKRGAIGGFLIGTGVSLMTVSATCQGDGWLCPSDPGAEILGGGVSMAIFGALLGMFIGHTDVIEAEGRPSLLLSNPAATGRRYAH